MFNNHYNFFKGVKIIAFIVLLLYTELSTIANNKRIQIEPVTSLLREHVGNINSAFHWDNLKNEDWSYSIIEVKPQQKISFKCYGMVFMAFLRSYYEPIKGESPDFCTSDPDYSRRLSFSAGEHSIIVPDEANYLYFSRLLNGRDSTPRYLYVDYENALDGIVSESPKAVFGDYPYDMQQVCIHHDSFCREITGKPWHIGSNGGNYFPMDYESPRFDYESVDDGFRIKKGILVNNQGVKIEEAFRFIKTTINREALIEIGVPKEISVYERFVFNYKDDNNFEYIQVFRKKRRVIIELSTRVNGIGSNKVVLKKRLTGKTIRFFTGENGIFIFCNNKRWGKVGSILKSELKCGLMIDKYHKYQYDFFNFFLLQPYKIYDESIYTDNGIELTHSCLKQGWVQDYSYSLDTIIAQKSRVAERFELRRSTITDYKNDRVEKSFNYQLLTNLRKIRIEFDVLIPNDFEADHSQDCLVQIHDRVDDASLEGRSPYFSIRLQNNKYVLTAMSIEKQEKHGFITNRIITISDCTPGKWNHFSIYLKEGYLMEHNPVTQVSINDKLVYESFEPNTNNNPRGGYVRYGLYKADWLKEKTGLIKSKVVYYDNFKVIM